MLFKKESDERLLKKESNTTFFKKRSELKPLSTKKKISFGVLTFMSVTVPMLPMEYIGDPLWSAYVLLIVAGFVYLHWFMKD